MLTHYEDFWDKAVGKDTSKIYKQLYSVIYSVVTKNIVSLPII